MRPVPDHKRLYAEACWASAFFANTQLALAVSWVRLHGPSAQIESLRLSTSCNWQIYIAGTLATYNHTCDSKSRCMDIFHGDHKTPWNARINRIWLRPKIYFQILEGISSTHGDVTSSSSYLSSLEVKAGSSEVQRFPGIGFSSCTAPTFSHVQGISNGGYELSFQNAPEWRMCTGTIPSTGAKTREAEFQRWSVQRFMECAKCAGIGIELIWKSSRVGQGEYGLSSIFRVRKHTWHRELEYSMKLSQGCM